MFPQFNSSARYFEIVIEGLLKKLIAILIGRFAPNAGVVSSMTIANVPPNVFDKSVF